MIKVHRGNALVPVLWAILGIMQAAHQVEAADGSGGFVVNPVGPRYPAKPGKGGWQHPGKEGPALKSTNMKQCAGTVRARVELDMSQLNSQEVSPAEGKKTVTLPLLGSTPFLNKAIQCRYGSGKVSLTYLLKCMQPTKSSVPNAYYCETFHLLQQTPPVPATPVKR